MPRLLVVLVCVVSFGSFASANARAETSPSAAPSSRAASDGEAGAQIRAKDAGTIDGAVTAIDYRAGTMTVQSGARRIDIVILPSTNIAGDDNFHTIADLKKGTHVEVILSKRAQTYTAQIIRLQ
jgi:hypothetical protein